MSLRVSQACFSPISAAGEEEGCEGGRHTEPPAHDNPTDTHPPPRPTDRALHSGDTLWRDNCQLIAMLVIVLARQAQKNCN